MSGDDAPCCRLDDQDFLRRFESATWPLAQWHHREHIKVAYLYLVTHPFADAMQRMRAGIKAYNAAQGVVETPTGGYHETLTQAWLRLVHVTLCEYGASDSSDQFCDEHPELMQLKALRFFYSRELIMSGRARAEYADPDLAPLPIGSKEFRPLPS